jgi:hypothetical protein
VTTTDLQVDGVHFTVPAEKTLGTRFANAWYTLWQRVPTLTGLSAGSGLAGDTVTITGSQFDTAIAVTFGSAQASYHIDSASQITATVPDSAVTGTVTVASPIGTAAAPSLFAVLPTVVSFAPDHGGPGTVVNLTGKTFKGATQVTVNGVPATFKVKSLTNIKLKVPIGATSGPISVTNAGGTTSSVGTFTVGS